MNNIIQLVDDDSSDNISVATSAASTQTNTPNKKHNKQKSAFTSIREQLVRRLHAKSAISGIRIYTIFRDLSAICALHAELEHLLVGTDIIPPPLPEPFFIVETQEAIIKNLKSFKFVNNKFNNKVIPDDKVAFEKKFESRKLKYGQPYLYNNSSLDLIEASKRPEFSYQLSMQCINPLDDGRLYTCMNQLQQYLESVFALIDFIHDYSLHENNYNGLSSFNPVDLDYLTASVNSTNVDASTKSNTIQDDLPHEIGKIFGKFLNILEGKSEDELPLEFRRLYRFDSSENFVDLYQESKINQPEMSLFQDQPVQEHNNLAKDNELVNSQMVTQQLPFTVSLLPNNINYPVYYLNESKYIRLIPPCYQPYSLNSGIGLSLIFHDSPATLYINKSEEDMLTLQKYVCAGCCEPLNPNVRANSLFNLNWINNNDKKNFLPCKLTGGLFCKRWCHSDERRILPAKLVLDWDPTPQRVCRQAAMFIDMIWSLPIINLDAINPMIFDCIPAMKQVKLFRRSISTLVDRCLSHPSYASQAFEAIADIIGDGDHNQNDDVDIGYDVKRFSSLTNGFAHSLHLCLCSNFYSMQDLYEIITQSSNIGDGVNKSYETHIEKLYRLYDKLREILPRKSRRLK